MSTSDREKKLQQALHESEAKYRSLYASMEEGFALHAIIRDKSGKTVDYTILDVNPSYETITGIPREKAIGSRASDLYGTGEPPFLDIYGKVAEFGQPTSFETTFNPLGKSFRISVFSPARGEFATVFGDITERKRTEEAMRETNEQLETRVKARTIELATTVETLLEEITERSKVEEALRAETAEHIQAVEELREKDRLLMQQSRQAAMGEMIGSIAHQWRQPLNVLGLIIQELVMLHESGELSMERLDASVDKAMGIIFLMSQTIDDFRNFFRPDKEKTLFSVNQLVTRTISLVEEGFKEQRVKVEVSTSGDPQINGYPNEYSQVLLNILFNARDAFSDRPGNGKARISVSSFTEEGKAVVTVTDNAGGIATEIMGKIFDPYFTTKEPGKGTGVGLFMAKTIIEKNMGGRLTARNTADGAEFRIEV